MDLALQIAFLLGSFVAMEGVAWFTHKHIMHGFLWRLHRDHHQPGESFFQRNDFFFLLFAVPGILLLYLSLVAGYGQALAWAGCGITAYGLCYLIVHDLFIHQRLPFPRRVGHPYLVALRKAHRLHHKHLERENGECFGMLWIPRSLFVHELRS